MSIPKEPRQIMINLMYLVLMALLALNVSNEILNAFKTLSLSIDRSNQSIDQKNNEVYAAIKENEKAPGQEAKVKPYREKADAVVKEADEMVKFLNDWKRRIVIEAGGYNQEPEDSALHIPARLDNIDATTKLLVENKGGDTMKQKILGMRQFLLSQLRSSDTASISPLMPLRITPARKTDHNPKADWSMENFDHMPAIAAMALFSKFQNDVRSSEALVLNRLFEEAHMKDIKFDTIGAVAVPKTSYAIEGDKIEASILLAAFNKAQRPTVIMQGGGGSTKPSVNGIVPWETIAKGTGLQTVRGKIELMTETGPVSRDWKFEYMVGTTGASMQLDKMNVFYIGVENPVTVAAAGYSVEDVSLMAPGATITGEKGHYVIKDLKTPDPKFEVTINAKTKEGSIKKVGGMLVRVKRIPDPVAMLNKQRGGAMNAAIFRAQIGPAAVLDNFDFDARFTIIAFNYSMLPKKGGDIIGPFPMNNRAGCRLQGAGENPNIVKAMAAARAGDKVFIDDIKATGPDGTVRNLGTLFFTLN
jgi:gliding motility-associated protein GldM